MTTTKLATEEIDASEVSARARQDARRGNPEWKRKLAWSARWLHTYLSMVSFLIILFFAATGLTLNHADWFDSQAKTMQRQGTMDQSWVSLPSANVAQDKILSYLRNVEHIRGDMSNFNVDDMQCYISFRGPGYEASAVIHRDTGAFDITETRSGFVAVLNDLHKGRDTGKTWSNVIDISAIAMTLISLTGITLILFLTKRRSSGLMAVAIGALICYVIYHFWVP